MNAETFDIPTLAKYLNRDARDLEKLAVQGRIPGRRVSGDWRFNRAEVNDWIEQELGSLSDAELANLEGGMASPTQPSRPSALRVSELLAEQTIAVPLLARTAPKVLQQLVETANGTWQIFMPDEVLEAVRAREELSSTALPGGVAIPHPRRPLPQAIGESVVAFGKTTCGIPFGGPQRGLTDLFFLILCRDQETHLQVLARLSRMFQREGFLDRLREAETSIDVLAAVRDVESQVIA